MLAAGHAAVAGKSGSRFGVNGSPPKVDFAKVHDHVHGVIAAIAPMDSVERFEGLGVTVIRAAARFTGPREVVADGRTVRAKWFVVATGSRAGVPPIPGLDKVTYLTNETVFERTESPDHLVIIGGGPIGAEMAQAHRDLGARVTLLEMFTILGKDDPELVDPLRLRLRADGIDVREGIKIEKVAKRKGGGITVTIEEDGKKKTVSGSTLLVAAGRLPNVEDLGLEAAGVAYTKTGITVDGRLRSSNKRIFAVGDVAGSYQFTHIAGYHAGIVIRNILFRMFWSKVDYSAVPWVTFTDPEVAHVGMNEVEAKARHGQISVLRWPYAENDRAQAERDVDGFIKVVTSRRGRVLGASIVGSQAGELILPWVIAVQTKMKIGTMAGIIAPYPTRSEVSKRAAGSYYVPSLFSERTRRVVRTLMKFA